MMGGMGGGNMWLAHSRRGDIDEDGTAIYNSRVVTRLARYFRRVQGGRVHHNGGRLRLHAGNGPDSLPHRQGCQPVHYKRRPGGPDVGRDCVRRGARRPLLRQLQPPSGDGEGEPASHLPAAQPALHPPPTAAHVVPQPEQGRLGDVARAERRLPVARVPGHHGHVHGRHAQPGWHRRHHVLGGLAADAGVAGPVAVPDLHRLLLAKGGAPGVPPRADCYLTRQAAPSPRTSPACASSRA